MKPSLSSVEYSRRIVYATYHVFSVCVLCLTLYIFNSRRKKAFGLPIYTLWRLYIICDICGNITQFFNEVTVLLPDAAFQFLYYETRFCQQYLGAASYLLFYTPSRYIQSAIALYYLVACAWPHLCYDHRRILVIQRVSIAVMCVLSGIASIPFMDRFENHKCYNNSFVLNEDDDACCWFDERTNRLLAAPAIAGFFCPVFYVALFMCRLHQRYKQPSPTDDLLESIESKLMKTALISALISYPYSFSLRYADNQTYEPYLRILNIIDMTANPYIHYWRSSVFRRQANDIFKQFCCDVSCQSSCKSQCRNSCKKVKQVQKQAKVKKVQKQANGRRNTGEILRLQDMMTS